MEQVCKQNFEETNLQEIRKHIENIQQIAPRLYKMLKAHRIQQNTSNKNFEMPRNLSLSPPFRNHRKFSHYQCISTLLSH